MAGKKFRPIKTVLKSSVSPEWKRFRCHVDCKFFVHDTAEVLADNLSPEQRIVAMRGVKSKNTSAEITVRKLCREVLKGNYYLSEPMHTKLLNIRHCAAGGRGKI